MMLHADLLEIAVCLVYILLELEQRKGQLGPGTVSARPVPPLILHKGGTAGRGALFWGDHSKRRAFYGLQCLAQLELINIQA